MIISKKKTHRPRTQRVTSRPLSRHFSGFGSFFLHFRNSTFSVWHLIPMCLDDAINTADVGIGFPAASTALAISNSIAQLLILSAGNKTKNQLDQSHSVWFLRKRRKQLCNPEVASIRLPSFVFLANKRKL